DQSKVQLVGCLTDLTQIATDQILADMQLMGLGKQAPEYNRSNITGDHLIHIDPSARIEYAFINATDGPIYIGADALVMDGAKIRGPAAIGSNAIIKSHAFLSKGVCIGPHCEIGGEVKHSIFLGNSNKSHEGYIGDSVIGEWCNLGALTSNSNLRNSFTDIQLWDYKQSRPMPTGHHKCGFFMGDFSRTAIQTQINSGTVIGVSSHVFGNGMAKVLVPSFTWGGIDDTELYDVEKAIAAAAKFCSFKDQSLTNETEELLRHLYAESAKDQENSL
ncbi:MAG: glucose-1-phosphate thymidylyltransferase, partial [Saprospiraceae bacterium]|nr:glucose-1-phosphate thymidylyltransferase [Saprospiraceae bacterium]